MRIHDYLRSRMIRFEMFLHPPAPSATRMAESVHVPGRRVAKGVLIKAGEAFTLAVLPATHRINLERLAQVLGVENVRLATEEEVVEIFNDCERGALPPFGRLYGLATILDASLAGGAEIVFVANSRHEGLRMRFRDYEAVEGPTRARFADLVSPKRSQRRAG